MIATFAVTAVSATATAQQPPATSPVVVPPRLKTDVGVAYPQQALDEHFAQTMVVELVLEIDAQGAVTGASVTTPRGHGFDEAAVEAAQRLLFDPALRDGTPVPSRIRFRYEFRPPSPRLVGRVATQATDHPITGALVVVRDSAGVEHRTSTATDGAWAAPNLPAGTAHITVTAEGKQPQEADEELAPGQETTVTLRLAPAGPPPATNAGAAASSPVEEVVVRGTRPPREVTKRTLEAQEIARIPGTNGDALRSLQNLPGVGLAPVFSGQLIVRGSAPADTNVFIDGTSIPLVYHFGGLSSVVPSELLDRIDFYPGNYSAVYGRGTGGMVDVGIRAPKTDGLHGLAQADLIDARLLVEGPVARGWSFLVAGRRSWFDVWLGPILSRIASVSVAPRYYDCQLVLNKDFSARSSLRILLFGSDDALDLINAKPVGPPNGNPNANLPPIVGALSYSTSFWRLQARYENKLAGSTELRLTTAYGDDALNVTGGANTTITTLHPLSARGELSQRIVHGATANLGVDLVYEPYDLNLQLPPVTQPGVPPGGPGQMPVRSRTSGSLFLPATYAELELVPWRGARFVPGLRADYDSATQAWDVAPRLTVRQDITSGFPRTTLKAGAGLFYEPPTVLQTDPNYGQAGLVSSRAAQYDLGFERELTRQIDLSTDLFYKSLDQLVVAGAGSSGEGYAYGAELLVRYKPDEHFFGWLSYTLSRSERRNGFGEPYYLFQFDQTHILTVLGSYKLGRGWQVGARFRLVSGNPYTPTTTGAYDATVGSQQGVAAFPPYGARLPFFQQLDLRVDKTWSFRSWRLSAYLDVQNVYIASNPVSITYNYNFTQSAYINGLPILPILGLRGEL